MSWQRLYAKFISAQWKNFKLKYYFINYLRLYVPKGWCRLLLRYRLKSVKSYTTAEINKRVNYYNKNSVSFSFGKSAESLQNFKYRKHCKNYFFDINQFTRYFPKHYKIKYELGDVITVPSVPTLLKSRPIHEENGNSVILKLNKVRHFVFVKDKIPFENKENKLLWRGNIYPHQKNRIDLIEKFQKNPICDVQYVNSLDNFPFEQGEKLTLYEQLKYKFIMSLEGNDVATNLKWIMSSNSIAVSPPLRYETWFMEGTLIPDYHYIQVAEDYSDLIEKIKYYSENIDAAKKIIRNANAYVEQFRDKRKESLISLLTLKKYFDLQKTT